MKDEDSTLLLMFGLYLWVQYRSDWAPALEQGGARVYDMLHDDAQHQQDLPRPERMIKQPPIVAARLKTLTGIATAAGFPNPELAAAIAMAESGGNAKQVTRSAPNAKHPEVSVGLWQINTLAHKQYSEEWLKSPENNSRAAFLISKQGRDWRPWGAYTNGSYKKFLP